MLVHPRIEVKINGTRCIARQDVGSTTLLQLSVQDAVAAVTLLFISFKRIIVLLYVVVTEPVDLPCFLSAYVASIFRTRKATNPSWVPG